MKLSKYIEELQKVLDKEGDLDLIYSSDDEGNAYHQAYHCGDIVYVESVQGNYLEVIDENELEDYDGYIKTYCIN